MLEQLDIQRIGAYFWALMLVFAGGALILAALGVSTEGDPATVLANENQRPIITSTDVGSARDALLETKGAGVGITPVRGTD